MDSDDQIVGTIWTRRKLLSMVAPAGAALVGGRSAKAVSATINRTALSIDLVATPAITEGPFFVDEKLKRSNLVEGYKRKSVVDGLPLELVFTIYVLRNGIGVRLPDAHIDVWHCDAAGIYSDEESGGIQEEDTKGQAWLRGYQITGADGVAKFQTIYPGWYMGRTVHIHFKVRLFKGPNETHEFTSQLFFDESLNDKVLAETPYNVRGKRHILNKGDGIYASPQADGTMVGSKLMANVSDGPKGKVAKFSIALNLD